MDNKTPKNSDANNTINDEKKKLLESKYKGYSSIKPKHPFLTEGARKDLDKIFWID